VFETILIAIDEDSHAHEAVRIGGRMAERLGSRVILFHVVPQPPTYAMQAGFYLPPFELRKAATEHGKAVLEQAATHLPDAVPSRILVKYAEYSAWREIVQLAERERAELIVLGAHSQGALQRPSLGSTAEKVSRHVRVPILLVR
jgi:nucleotide-binding universal stress UspA family protein